MKALITGGNGFVGSWLARRLAERGDQVRILLRPSSDVGALAGVPFERLSGDLDDASSLARAVSGVEVVFHLAGIRRAPTREAFFRVNAEGTRALCEAAVAGGAHCRIILASSIAAVGPSRERPDEAAPLAPADWYGESKAEAERIALSYRDRLPLVIARPTRILGPGDRENLAFFKVVAKGFKLSIGGGPRPFSTIDVEDVVKALILMADNPAAVGEAFFVSRDETTLEGIQDEVARVLGLSPRPIRLPQALFKALASGADVISRATGKHLPLNRKMAQQLLAPGWTCSTRKAKEKLGFQASVPLAASVASSARFYRERGWV